MGGSSSKSIQSQVDQSAEAQAAMNALQNTLESDSDALICKQLGLDKPPKPSDDNVEGYQKSVTMVYAENVTIDNVLSTATSMVTASGITELLPNVVALSQVVVSNIIGTGSVSVGSKVTSVRVTTQAGKRYQVISTISTAACDTAKYFVSRQFNTIYALLVIRDIPKQVATIDSAEEEEEGGLVVLGELEDISEPAPPLV